MPNFKICVEWKTSGEYMVEAETLDEAIEKVLDNDDDKYSTNAATGKEYLDDSFKVNKDLTYAVNEVERYPSV